VKIGNEGKTDIKIDTFDHKSEFVSQKMYGDDCLL